MEKRGKTEKKDTRATVTMRNQGDHGKTETK